MKKFGRIISVIVALSMIMSMSTLCLIATAETASGGASLLDGVMWKLEDYISIGEVGSNVATSNAPFGLDSKSSSLKTTVANVNGVASVVRSDGKRAFSKSDSGIIDITPADGTCSQVYFTAPKTAIYTFNVELQKTDMSSLPANAIINNWTEVGPRTGLSSTFGAFPGLSNGVNYTGAAIGNGSGFTATGLTFSGNVSLSAGQVIVISINAGDNNNTDETQTTVKKFEVRKVIEAHTFNCKVGTRSIEPSVYNNDGVYDDGHFKLGSFFNGRPFGLVYTDTVVNGWGNPMAGIDNTYEGFGANTDTVGEGARGGNWAWAFAKDDGDGITDYHQIFITPQTGTSLDLSPKYALPSVIVYTAEHDGVYRYDSQFKAASTAVGVKLTVAAGTGYYDEEEDTYVPEYMMSMSEPNFFAETQYTTANSVHNFEGIVELKAGQTILFIAENPIAMESPEVGVMKLNVMYMAEHKCSEFEGADCQTAGKCVLCGASETKDPDNHVEEPTGYTDLGNGTHRVAYANCCGASSVESHDFSSVTCVCGAYNTANMENAEYLVALTAPASWVSAGGTGTVNISVELTGNATEYASGEVTVGYDPNLFVFDAAAFTASAPEGVSVYTGQDGKVILMVMGATKTLNEGFNTVATLPFAAKQSANTSTFTLEDAGFSTAERAQQDGVVTAVKYSDKVISSVYNVTLSSVLEGEAIVVGLTDYTFTVKTGNAKDYTVTYKVGNGETLTITADANGVFTIPGEKVTDDIVVTAAIKGTAASPSKEYAPLKNGKKLYLILYNRGQDGPLEGAHLTVDVDGNGGAEPVQMIWADKYNAYCYLVISDTALDVAECTFALASGEGPTLPNSFDVNRTGVLDANDAQLAYNMYNFDYSGFDNDITMEKYLLADANGDMVIDVKDVTKICSECAASE